MTLPPTDHSHYMASLLRGPRDAWRPALALIAADHGVDVASAVPTGVGRNVVLATPEWVVKLVPPFWLNMWRNECLALAHADGRLSVRTPKLVAFGEIDGWGFIVMGRESGTSLGWRGDQGSAAERTALSRLQGRLVREVGALSSVDSISWDWHRIITVDRAAMERDLVGVPDHLVASAEDYVDRVGDLAAGNTFLHGDLSSVNILLDPSEGPCLVDWSDASVGPGDHEFISPFMHQFRGRSEDLAAFWEGYGSVADAETLAHRIMARSIVKYASLMGRYLGDLPGPTPRSWEEAAARFTLLT